MQQQMSCRMLFMVEISWNKLVKTIQTQFSGQKAYVGSLFVGMNIEQLEYILRWDLNPHGSWDQYIWQTLI